MRRKMTRKVLVMAAIMGLPTVALATDDYTSTKHAGKYPTYPKINLGKYPKKKAQQIKRGEYLTKLGDCIACHTKPDGKTFAGSHAFKTPFGTLYTPNITPDKTTGIGTWSDKDFIKAMHEGKSPQGDYYYPAFPYIYFNAITTEDLKAIKAYLDVIPAVNQANKKNDLTFPFNWHFLQLGWRILFFDNDAAYQINKKQSALWNRGKYLVNGLGHCSMCHTPMHNFIFKKWVLAAPIKKYYLTGSMVEGFYAPNITSTNLKNTPLQDIADVFLKDKLIGGGKVQGPMAEANHDSLKYLKPNDIKAIAIYLKSVKSKTPPKPHASGMGLDAAGQAIYAQHCASCHATGAGDAPIVGNLKDWRPRIKLGLNTLYKNAINSIGGMPAKGACMSCSTKNIQDAVKYMVHHSTPGSAGAGVSQTPKGKAYRILTIKGG